MDTIVTEVRSIIDAPLMQRPDTLKKPLSGGDIVLENVRFSYGEKEILHGISMTVPQGGFIALVGPSGSGKSTVARLIASLWDVGGGGITVGGTDLRDIPLDDYNQMIAYVSQDNYLFSFFEKRFSCYHYSISVADRQ